MNSRSFGVLLALCFVVVAAPTLAQPSFEDQVMEIVNQERWNNGQLPPLKRHSALDASAEGHSTNMAVRNFFAHCDLDTHTLPWDRMEAAGYVWNYAGENIAAGYNTPQLVMAGWMQSSGHRANILSLNFKDIGIGYYIQSPDQSNVRLDGGNCSSGGTSGPYTRYWTQNFGTRSGSYPVVIEREAYESASREIDLYVYGSGWATEMRFRNETGTFSAWEPYRNAKTWTLSAGNGTKTVRVELRKGTSVVWSEDTIVLSGDDATAVPWETAQLTTFRMQAAYPNPFRAQTRLAFDLVEDGPVQILVFDIAGRQVAALHDGPLAAGAHEVVWDGANGSGRAAARGVYFIRVRTRSEQAAQRVILE